MKQRGHWYLEANSDIDIWKQYDIYFEVNVLKEVIIWIIWVEYWMWLRVNNDLISFPDYAATERYSSETCPHVVWKEMPKLLSIS